MPPDVSAGGADGANRRGQRAPTQRAAAPPRPGRRRGPAGPQQRLRTTGPRSPSAAPQQPAQGPQPVQDGQRAAGSRRMPFVLLLCGLLGGALVSALVISTTLAEGSFQISKLQNSTTSLAKQRQALAEAVAQAQAPQQIAQRASRLGMRRSGELQFIDLKSGKTSNDGPAWGGAVNAPGYAP